jgi:acylphosphatase
MVRKRVRYIGRVQGVGFRAMAQWLAEVSAVSGWVRNDPDGSVVLEAQGEPDKLEEFLGAVRGRLGRNISAEQAAEVAPDADERGFRVAR